MNGTKEGKAALEARVLEYVKKSGGATSDDVRRDLKLPGATALLNRLVKANRLRFGSYGGYKAWDAEHERKPGGGWTLKKPLELTRDPENDCARFTVYWPMKEQVAA